MFVENIQGILMNVVQNEGTGYEYEIWFPYTKNSINTLRDGTLLAVKNFASSDNADCLSILQITSVLPMHYALGSDRTGYPGFVEEAAVSAAQDWRQETPTEETTKIICKAIPSYVEIKIPSSLGSQGATDPAIATESNIPMIGERAKMLNSEWTQKLVNKGLTEIQDKTITMGRLVGSTDVEILALWEELVQTHFGVFAYTKAGKSNLVSTCVSKMLEKAPTLKILVFDLMSEYGALLIDALCNTRDAAIVCYRPETMPSSVVRYWGDPNNTNLNQAASDILNTTLLPKYLKPMQSKFIEPLKHLLSSRKIRLYLESRNVGEIIEEVKDDLMRGNLGTYRNRYLSFIDGLIQNHRITTLTRTGIDGVITEINHWIDNPPSLSTGTQTTGQGRAPTIAASIRESATRLIEILEAAKANLGIQSTIRPEFTIRLNDIITSLNNESSSSLFVIQSNLDEDLRRLAYSVGNIMLSARRNRGQISPLVSFIFDEADMFIPGGNVEENGIGQSRYIAEQLARRGRKYGLGIGIATQRIVYLDTNVLGQPHTYFISKLPRQSDRQRIQDAFGISEEAMQQTLRFEKGQWLLVSDDATGMEGVPIPVSIPDANLRISEFLNNFNQQQQTR